MNVLFFIGAFVPPSLIVLISLRSIPGYLALSGLLWPGKLSSDENAGHLNLRDRSGCSRFKHCFLFFIGVLACFTGFIGAGTGAGLVKPTGTAIAFQKAFLIWKLSVLCLFFAQLAVKWYPALSIQ